MSNPHRNSRVCIVSSPNDAHIPFVTRYLNDVPVIIDAKSIIEKEELTYTLDKGLLSISHKGQVLDGIVGVWYRMTREAEHLVLPVSEEYLKYCRTAILQHSTALYSQLESAVWASSPYAIRRAEHKPLQLSIAARLGFRVPDTIFTNDPDKAKNFVDKYPVSITKSLATSYPVDFANHTGSMFFAKKLHIGKEHNFSGLNLAPAIFQEAVDADSDIRVTVIGNKVFAARITVSGVDKESQVRDWRVGYSKGKIHIEPYELPKDIASKCIALVKELGLNYGAIDLVLDKKDKLWFLENNPNGQWGFVEEETGQPIGKTLAEFLMSGLLL